MQTASRAELERAVKATGLGLALGFVMLLLRDRSRRRDGP
jgi:hypothetical protein